MSETRDAVVRKWQEWTPDSPQTIYFRENEAGDHKETLQLLSAELTCSEDNSDFAFRIKIQCDRDAYQRMESERWFEIPVGFSDFIEVGFGKDTPIQITADFQDWLMYELLNPFESSDLSECLAQLLRPLLVEEEYAFTACSLSYNVVEVVQDLPNGNRIGFSADKIEQEGF